MILSKNIPSLNIYSSYVNSVEAQAVSMRKISSGVQVSKSRDNPDALDKSQKINMQVRGLQIASKNSQDAASLLQTADGGLNEMNSTLQRIRELTIQANSGTNTVDDRNTIQTEIGQLIKGFDDLSSGTSFNGVNIINNQDPALKSIPVAVGANAYDLINIPTFNISSKTSGANGLFLSSIDVSTESGAALALDSIDGALDDVNRVRSKLGALQNTFESSFAKSNEMADTLSVCSSDLTDTDIAEEMVKFSSAGVSQEASTAMLVQTNRFPMDILKILQNVR